MQTTNGAAISATKSWSQFPKELGGVPPVRVGFGSWESPTFAKLHAGPLEPRRGNLLRKPKRRVFKELFDVVCHRLLSTL